MPTDIPVRFRRAQFQNRFKALVAVVGLAVAAVLFSSGLGGVATPDDARQRHAPLALSAGTIAAVKPVNMLVGRMDTDAVKLTPRPPHETRSRKAISPQHLRQVCKWSKRELPPFERCPPATTRRDKTFVSLLTAHPIERNWGATCVSNIEALTRDLPLNLPGAFRCAGMCSWRSVGRHAGAIDEEEIDRRKLDARKLFSRCPPPAREQRRRVYIDLGARTFDSSVGFFFKHYPNGETFEVHAFEADAVFAGGFANRSNVHFYNTAVWTDNGYLTFRTSTMLDSTLTLFSKTGPPRAAVSGHGIDGAGDTETPRKADSFTVPALDIAEWAIAHVAPEDFVVMKMDVEGIELALLSHLVRRGAMARIDELFLECHSVEWVPGWAQRGKTTTLDECHSVVNALRDGGVYVHEWF